MLVRRDVEVFPWSCIEPQILCQIEQKAGIITPMPIIFHIPTLVLIPFLADCDQPAARTVSADNLILDFALFVGGVDAHQNDVWDVVFFLTGTRFGLTVQFFEYLD